MATNPKRKKAEPILEQVRPVAPFKVPCRYSYAETPLDIASNYTDAEIEKKAANSKLEAVSIGDFVAVRNEECEETFIIRKSVLRELVEAAA